MTLIIHIGEKEKQTFLRLPSSPPNVFMSTLKKVISFNLEEIWRKEFLKKNDVCIITLNPQTYHPRRPATCDETFITSSHYAQHTVCLWCLGRIHFVLILPHSFTWHLVCSPPAPIASAALSHSTKTGEDCWRQSVRDAQTSLFNPLLLRQPFPKRLKSHMSETIWNCYSPSSSSIYIQI